MAEKKQKTLAREYFKDSELFDCDVLSGMDNSATSSSAEYELTCKKCNATFKRKGNAKNLRTCAGCKRVWNREDNSIVEPEPKAGKAKATAKAKVEEEEEEEIPMPTRKSARVAARKAAVVESEEEEVPVKKTPAKKVAKPVVDSDEEEEEEVAPKKTAAKKLPDHDIDLLAQILMGDVESHEAKAAPKKLKNELQEGEHWVEEILDYYDGHEDGRWHRFYYCKWWNDDTLTFTRADNFGDQKMIEKYEKSLPTAERFRNMFPNPKISKKAGSEKIGHRTKADVEKETAEEIADAVQEPVREKFQMDIVYLKAGHRYFDRKTSTLFLLEGDKDHDQIVFHML